jgi:hypothetical protein
MAPPHTRANGANVALLTFASTWVRVRLGFAKISAGAEVSLRRD